MPAVHPAEVASPGPWPPERVRNVVLVGPQGAGRTTLVRALAAVTDPAAALDTGAPEPTAALVRTSLEHDGVRVDLLDTPGRWDLVGARAAGLRAADAALFVVSAAGGLDPVTAQQWAVCEAAGTPRLLVVSQLDAPRADLDEAVALAQRLLDDEVLPLHLPMHDDDGTVAGLVDLLTETVADSSSGERVVRPADPEHRTLIGSVRDDLVETVLGLSEDEVLLDRYLDGEALDPAVLTGELRSAVGAGLLCPAVGVSPAAGVGLVELLDLLVHALPSPVDRPCPQVSAPDGSPVEPLRCDPDGPLAAEVVALTDDPDRVALVRVWSGTLRAGTGVLLPGEHVVALVGDLEGGSPAVAAGSLGTVAGLTSVAVGDVLCAPEAPLRLAPWDLPEPQHPVELALPEDRPGLEAALAQLTAEDPVLRVEPAADRFRLLTVGPDSAELLLQRLRGHYGLPVEVVPAQAGPGRSSVTVVLPTAFARTVMSDLRGRGASDLTSEQDLEDDETTTVRAQLSDQALLAYAVALRSLSSGTARMSRHPVP